MSQQAEEKPGTTICYYLVAYIDVLSQKSALRRLRDLPETLENNEAFVQSLRDTFGAVRQFRELFNVFYNSRVPPERIADLPADLRARVAGMTRQEVYVQRMSDAVVIYLPLAREEVVRINGVHSVLLACCAVVLMSMADQQVFRGGIEIGVGAEIEPGEIYGAALSRAVELESEIAQYPRIVIGDELLQFILETANQAAPDPPAHYIRGIARKCLDLIYIDVDGRPIVHYLGEGHRQQMGEELRRSVIDEFLLDAYCFLQQQAATFSKTLNTKLAFRYAVLLRYFEKHLSVWQDGAIDVDERNPADEP